jgi:hypothetical protein
VWYGEFRYEYILLKGSYFDILLFKELKELKGNCSFPIGVEMML